MSYVFWFVLLVAVLWWLGVFQLLIYVVQMKRVPRPLLLKQNGKGIPKILILGESIALGYGVWSVYDGFSGRIGRSFLEASVKVLAVPFKGTVEFLKLVPMGGRYDVVVLTTSGNDLMVRNQEKLASNLNTVLQKCLLVSRNIVVLGNFDNLYRAKYFAGRWWFKPLPWLLQKFFEKQSHRVKKTYQNVLAAEGLSDSLVEVKVPMNEDDTSYDGVHPNRDGHAYFAKPVITKMKSILTA